MPETITEFIDKFTKNEYELNRVFYCEKDENLLDNIFKEVASYFLPGTNSGLMNKFLTTRNESWFERNKEAINYVKPRTVFKIEEYNCPDLGVLFRCHLGQNSTSYPEKAYLNFFVVEVEGKFKIAADFHFCTFCKGTGLIDDKKCPECTSGLNIRVIDKASRHFLPPASVEIQDKVIKFIRKNLR